MASPYKSLQPANSGDGSFANLLGEKFIDGTPGYNVQNSTEGYNKINNWPLNFLRTGYYNRSYGYIHGRPSDGYWWSLASFSSTSAHYLGTYPTNVYPQGNSYRGHGFAIRCVIREG